MSPEKRLQKTRDVYVVEPLEKCHCGSTTFIDKEGRLICSASGDILRDSQSKGASSTTNSSTD